MSGIEADIALESWLFGFRPYSGQGQFTLVGQPIAGRIVVSCWLSKFNLSILSMS